MAETMANSEHAIPTPFGVMVATVDDEGAAVQLLLPGSAAHRAAANLGARGPRDVAVAGPLLEQLGEYFAGRRRTFTVPVRPEGTPFQRRVWQALQEIPYGTTISYSELADRIGDPNAVRAVGLANGRNPVPIIIPCHRVIGKDGSLTGFGGGMALKASLLRLEGAAFAGAGRPTEQLMLP
jgi:methylated-DNA-[protein]-cysteine S-methyltransferase